MAGAPTAMLDGEVIVSIEATDGGTRFLTTGNIKPRMGLNMREQVFSILA